MTIALWLLVFVALRIGAHYLLRWHEAGQVNALRRHATREAIRQEMGLDRWSKGEMPLAEPQVDKSLARRIARAKPARVIQFRNGTQ